MTVSKWIYRGSQVFDESNFTLQVQWEKVQITHAQHNEMLLVHTTDLQVLHFQSRSTAV